MKLMMKALDRKLGSGNDGVNWKVFGICDSLIYYLWYTDGRNVLSPGNCIYSVQVSSLFTICLLSDACRKP